MTEKSKISIAAFVSKNEQAAVQLAASHVARALSEAAGSPWTCECTFSSELEMSVPSSDATIIVTSLLPELEKLEEPWSEVEQRLRTTYAAIGAHGNPIFISTIFRHIGGGEKTEHSEDLTVRIRRLNLLAAEISRETRAYVIDLDRIMTEHGARRLQADYQLKGAVAIETAGHFIALTLVSDALDAMVPFEVQDAAKVILERWQPVIGNDQKNKITVDKNLLRMGRGRRKQLVSAVVDSHQQNHAGWLVRQVLSGGIGPGEAMEKLVQVVRRRGVRESTLLLVSGLSRTISRKK